MDSRWHGHDGRRQGPMKKTARQGLLYEIDDDDEDDDTSTNPIDRWRGCHCHYKLNPAHRRRDVLSRRVRAVSPKIPWLRRYLRDREVKIAEGTLDDVEVEEPFIPQPLRPVICKILSIALTPYSESYTRDVYFYSYDDSITKSPLPGHNMVGDDWWLMWWCTRW